VIIAGHALVRSLRRAHYQLTTGVGHRCVEGRLDVGQGLPTREVPGIDMIAAVNTPEGWQAAGGGSDPNDQYFPANGGQPPFKVPYNRWTRRYWALDWSLARSFEVYDAAARAAGWQPYACPSTAERRPTKTRGCWERPAFVLTVDFDSTDGSCNPRTHNCGTTIDVELSERTAEYDLWRGMAP